MATSGTIGQTIIDTDKVLKHGVLRIGKTPADLTPEVVENATESIYVMLLSLMNQGLNLWAIDKQILGLKNMQAGYVLATGTIEVENVIYSTTTQASYSLSATATSVTAAISATAQVCRIGFRTTSAVTAAFVIDHSTNNSTWSIINSIPSQTLAAGQWVWFDVDPNIIDNFFRISSVTPFALQDFYLATSVNTIPMTPWSRDEYAAQPNLLQPGKPATNYYFEKLINPKMSFWPVPNNDYDQVIYWRERQLQDVGTLTQQLEVPQRWLESIFWEVAVRLGIEIPGVDANKMQFAVTMAAKYTAEAGSAENDGAPVYITPNIAPYSA